MWDRGYDQMVADIKDRFGLSWRHGLTYPDALKDMS